LEVKKRLLIFAAKKQRIMADKQNLSRANKRKVYLKASDFFLDLAKLVFGGIILTGIVGMDVNKAWLFIVGGIVVVLLALWGYIMFIRGIKTY
jgi:hypothetical protein